MRTVLRAAAVIVLVGAGWLGWQAYHVLSALHDITGHKVDRLAGEPVIKIPPLNGNHRINFLVLGSDNDRKKEEARPLTQSMIVVTVDPINDRVGMLSIPRDFWVPIRGHGMGKIDLAHKYGGVGLARATVEQLFHIPIHYYAWVGLSGFVRVLDTFNGVTLNVSHPILDDTYPDDLNAANPYAYKRVFIPAGWQHLDGSQALEYVRSRHGDLVGDFGRSTRQQQVLLQLDQKLNTLNVLTNLPQLADDLKGSVRTDLGPFQLLQLAELSRHIHAQNVSQVVLQAPTYSHYDWRNGQSVVIPDWPKIRPVVKNMFAPIRPPASAIGPQTVGRGGARQGGKPGRADPVSVHPATPSHQRPPTARTAPFLSTGPLPGNFVYVQNGNVYELTRGHNARQLTSTGDAAMPALSPDGRSLAFVRFSTYASDLWLLELRSHRAVQLTHGTDRDVRNNLRAAWPTWIDGGKALAFSWDQWKTAQPPSDARPVDLAIYRVQPGGGTPVRLSIPARGSGGDTEATGRPRSGQYLYVKWNYDQRTNQPYSQLVLADPASNSSWPLTQAGGRVLQPAWDATGRRIVFVRKTKGRDEIAVAPVVAGKSGPQLGPRIVIASGKVADPAFTPDGKWISYLQAAGDGFTLLIAPASGGPAVTLDGVPGDVDARWRPIWTR